MTLRARLALLYTSVVGGILLLFGTAVYITVSITLNNQVNNILENTAAQIWPRVTVGPQGRLMTQDTITQQIATGVYVQIWDRDDNVFVINNIPLDRPLDPEGLNTSRVTWRNVSIGSARLRVLSVPLMGSDRNLGVLQTAVSITVVETTLLLLLRVLLLGVIISMLLAAIGGWFITRQALAPLKAVTQTALQITRADDLSRRIPYQGPPNDEIGQLIHAFNQTLSRLENLFNTQRRFLADVGHELRTPLTVIKGNVDLMRRMNSIDDESMVSIENEVDRLTRMVGDLLLLAQAEAGKLPLAQRTVEMDTLLLDAMHQMRVLARDRLQLKLGDIDQVLVCGDQDRLKQVLVNLIGNAIQYTPPGGEVLVGLGKQDQWARLTVSDSGPGIPPEDIPHIFERFYRGEKSRTRSKDGKGFGLGLSIAYWIVRNHGGKIEVAPREPVGTTFCVWLPLAGGPCTDEIPG